MDHEHSELFKDDKKYLTGFQNVIIRAYFYCSNGLGILNEFRNLFLGIFAIYIALKLESIWWMIGMFIPCVAILIVAGYYVTHKVSKVREWLGMRFGTHFGIKTFNYNEGSYELLKEIRDLLLKQQK